MIEWNFKIGNKKNENEQLNMQEWKSEMEFNWSLSYKESKKFSGILFLTQNKFIKFPY